MSGKVKCGNDDSGKEDLKENDSEKEQCGNQDSGKENSEKEQF